MDEAERCHRLLLMREGEILADDTPEALRTRTGSDTVEEAFLHLVDEASRRRGTRPGDHPMSTRRPRLHTGPHPRHRRPRPAPAPPRPALHRADAPGPLRDAPPAALRLRRQPADLRQHRRLAPRHLPPHHDVPGHLHRHPPRTHLRHPRTPPRHAARQGRPHRRLRPRLRRPRGHPVRSSPPASPSGSSASTSSASPWLLLLVALLDALLGTALGLFVSAFAASEFQAVQFMPAVIFPQLLLCGLFTPRDQMHPALEAISDVLPMSYAVDGMNEVLAPHRHHRRLRPRRP